MTGPETHKAGALALAYSAEQVQDLRRRLRDAEAERDASEGERRHLWEMYKALEAERDAARAEVARLHAALDELVAEHDSYWSNRVDSEPGVMWPCETGGMILARIALRTCGGGQ
jgi:chromosome segregation ATPase